MKKSFLFVTIMTIGLGLAGCFKDIDRTFDEYKLVEFETAVRSTPAAGFTFPIVNITRTAGTVAAQVNLVGTHFKTGEEMSFSIDTAVSKLLNATTIRAVEGVHFNLNGGKFTFKADTSFSFARFNVLNPGATAGRTAILVLKLDGSSTIKPAENYRRIGYRIDLK